MFSGEVEITSFKTLIEPTGDRTNFYHTYGVHANGYITEDLIQEDIYCKMGTRQLRDFTILFLIYNAILINY